MPKPVKTSLSLSEPTVARHSQEVARVWDPIVRLLHWSLVLSFFVAWVTRHSSAEVHYWAGYFAAGLIFLRLLWGWLGTPYARFSRFVRSPATVARYLIVMLSGREVRHIGHNPAGGAMVLALIVGLVATALTGWMMTTDTYFGVEWVGRAHDLIAHGVLALVLVHIAGVLVASLRHQENLVRAMITGHKRRAEAGDVA